MGDLTKNFSLEEFLVSDTAERLGIANTPTPQHEKRIRDVTAPGFQLVRDAVARSVVLTSGYRNPRVNRAVGGTASSAHPQGYAGDAIAAALSPFAFATIVAKAMAKGGKLHGKIDQLILEPSRGVVHISFDPRARGQILTQKGGPGSPIVKGLVA